MNKLTTEHILSYSLAFVVIWFGVNEVLSPQNWVAFVPSFFGDGQLAVWLVISHGVALTAFGLALFFNFYRKIAAALLALMLLEIIGNLILESGLSEIAVRDIGLLGAATALFFVDKDSIFEL